MARTSLPGRLKRVRTPSDDRLCAGHRAWVRRHNCSVKGCSGTQIECAHVRQGTDGGVGLKPSDKWAVSLCSKHHAEQHSIGEAAFEKKYCLDLLELATEFWARSPHRVKQMREA